MKLIFVVKNEEEIQIMFSNLSFKLKATSSNAKLAHFFHPLLFASNSASQVSFSLLNLMTWYVDTLNCFVIFIICFASETALCRSLWD
jgi:hypothetical protein